MLDADDAAGLVEILEGIRSVRDAGLPHRSIEVLFPVAEDIYIKGSCAFDFSRIQVQEILRAYAVPENAPVVCQFQRICRKLGVAGALRSTLGGSDSHIFLKAGISGIILSCEMQRVHSTEEYIAVQELMCSAALVAGLICDDHSA